MCALRTTKRDPLTPPIQPLLARFLPRSWNPRLLRRGCENHRVVTVVLATMTAASWRWYNEPQPIPPPSRLMPELIRQIQLNGNSSIPRRAHIAAMCREIRVHYGLRLENSFRSHTLCWEELQSSDPNRFGRHPKRAKRTRNWTNCMLLLPMCLGDFGMCVIVVGENAPQNGSVPLLLLQPQAMMHRPIDNFTSSPLGYNWGPQYWQNSDIS